MNPFNNPSNYSGIQYEIINNDTRPVLVRKNGGFNYIIPPSIHLDVYVPHLLKVKFTLPNNNTIYFDLDSVTNTLDREILTILQEKVKNEADNRKFMSDAFVMIIEFSIPITKEHVGNDEGEIISDLLGFRLTQRLSEAKELIGNTVASECSDLYKEVTEGTESKSLVMGIRLVDPKNQLPGLWTQCLGEGVSVPVIRNEDRPAGLYFTRYLRGVKPEKCFISIEDIDESTLKRLGLYSSKNLAAMGGNSKLLQSMQSKVEEKVLENAKLESNNEELTLKHRQTSNVVENLKRQMALTKIAQSAADAQNKLQYEITKSKHNSNAFGDFIKGLVSVIGLAFTGIKLFC